MVVVLEGRTEVGVGDVGGLRKGEECEAIRGVGDYEHSLFVERYLEKPVYNGDPQMLTLPTACTFRGVPLLDDW